MDARQLARAGRIGAATALAASLAACASVQPHYPIHGAAVARTGPSSYKIGAPYQVGGVWYVPREQPNYDEVGVASWYGDEFHLKPTADGEIFDMNAVSGAHTTLPLPSIVEVTNLDNGRKLRVRVNDRGPFVGGRIIDLSHEAARELGYDRQGLAHVRVRYVGPAPLLGPEAGVQYAKAAPRPASPAAPIRVAAAAPAPSRPRWTPPMPSLPSAAAPAAAAASASPDGAVFAAPPVEPVAVAARPLAPLTGAALGPPTRAAQAVQAAAGPAPSPASGDGPPGDGAATLRPSDGATVRTAAAQTPPTGFRIQAGAFASRLNAERAVAELADAGQAVIEPLERNGSTLFRVYVPAPADEAEAYALRDRVAAIGFADARVIQSF